MNKICLRCGIEFETNRIRKVYCNEVCRMRAEQERYRQTEGFKRNKAKENQRRNERIRLTRPSRFYVCQECGKEFEKNNRGLQPKYCSHKCSRDFKARRARENQIDIPSTVLCPTCLKPLTQNQVKRGVTYCSQNCYAVSRRTLIGTLRTCAVCGSGFEPAHKDQKCCGNKCAKKQQAKTITGLKNTNVVVICEICGQQFHPSSNRSNPKTCSKYCKRRRDSINKIKSGYRKKVNRQRQVIISATESEPIDKAAIYQRDGWICQVCGKKVNPKLTYPNPMSASLDHILPFALGGSHTKANVQLAHLRCNIKKSDSSGGQLRLLSEV